MADLQTAYAEFHVKSIDVERRIIRGIATSPGVDRAGDVVEMSGITVRNPIPLLLHHKKDLPVGTATLGAATKDGIPFEAEIAVFGDAGTVRDRLDEAWHSIKAGLLRGVSIGFRVIGDALDVIRDTGGLRFKAIEILELSLVAIPANVNATITAIKSLDTAALRHHSPGASGTAPPKGGRVMTIQEQITQWENSRAAKDARMVELMNTAAATSSTLDEKASEEYDGLAAEVKNIDIHLVRLNAAEAANRARAVPITAASPADASVQRGGVPVLTVKANVPKGTGFIRLCQAMAVSHGNKMEAVEYAKRWKDSTPEVEMILKAAVAAGTTTDATWAGPLAPLRPLQDEFLEFLRPATIIGRIPNLHQVPFNVSIPSQTGGGSYSWVGQGAPKPVGKLQFGTATVGITKAAGIIVITEELARNSTPSAEETIRKDMVAGIAYFLDVEFTDPAKAPVANVSPGSVTNGITPITSAGTTPANGRTDVAAMIGAMTAAGLSATQATLLMSESNAAALSNALNPLGQPLFPGLSIEGGKALGVNVVTSQAVSSNVILLHGPSILIADDGGVTIDVSREASVQMDSAPMNPPDATVVLQSLWQLNLVGLRAERFINWKRVRAGSVQYVVQTYVG